MKARRILYALNKAHAITVDGGPVIYTWSASPYSTADKDGGEVFYVDWFTDKGDGYEVSASFDELENAATIGNQIAFQGERSWHYISLFKLAPLKVPRRLKKGTT